MTVHSIELNNNVDAHLHIYNHIQVINNNISLNVAVVHKTKKTFKKVLFRSEPSKY